ncbi:Predicted membrane protein [Psychrobacillus sp. OK032]|nr:Predicted membrane protein [Psychrobacillus sp. OK032]
MFQLYDGIIQHKLMGLHQIRYNVNIIPYDLVWNISAIIMIVIGIVLLYRTQR